MNPSRIYVEVDLSAICNNVKRVMENVGENVKVMAVIKTDAYGHGAVDVAKALRKIGVYAFAVATIDEATQLREAGIDNPILILGYVFEPDFDKVFSEDITTTVFSEENARTLSEAAKKAGKIAKVHIKLDTGMGRIGFIPSEESAREIENIFAMPNLDVEGVFSHFSTADEADKSFTLKQAKIFDEFVELLESKGLKFRIKHICNSAGIIDLAERDKPNFKYDMVRSGIMTYGLYPSEDVNKAKIKLEPAMRLVSHIAYVKEVPAGFTVSYGKTFVTKRKTKIATIPVGYGDGYPRALSNKGKVIIGEKFAPIIGRVCMDQFMVDVTEIENVKQGDEVILVGTQGEKTLTVEEVSELAGTFNYEFICGINKRVPRVYVGE